VVLGPEFSARAGATDRHHMEAVDCETGPTTRMTSRRKIARDLMI
jgi:hypothetical protein